RCSSIFLSFTSRVRYVPANGSTAATYIYDYFIKDHLYNKRISPSIILKVMVGDTIQAAARAYYKQQAEPRKKVSVPAEQMLAGLLQALVAPGSQAMATHGGQVMANARIAGPGLTANDLTQLKNNDPEN